jgi:hypothetical protein
MSVESVITNYFIHELFGVVVRALNAILKVLNRIPMYRKNI